MAKNHVQPGAVMPWTNATGTDVASGDVVKVGLRIGIALENIANTASGQLAIAEVWEIPKVAPLVISQGDLVYWDVADANVNKTATDNFIAGFAFESAVSAATTVKVKLNA